MDWDVYSKKTFHDMYVVIIEWCKLRLETMVMECLYSTFARTRELRSWFSCELIISGTTSEYNEAMCIVLSQSLLYYLLPSQNSFINQTGTNKLWDMYAFCIYFVSDTLLKKCYYDCISTARVGTVVHNTILSLWCIANEGWKFSTRSDWDFESASES